mmetsp:Transcript_8424/g.8336  ORF Transcript_8424/g.8336 Transcript_8424/m.8336 type:complete len:437 (+) Transcript_8424:202-1512(+)
MGFTCPTKIQEQSIPEVLKGKDVILCAQTGSGKTAAFGLPILSRLLSSRARFVTKVLVLSPTRELSQQTHSMIKSFAKFTKLNCQVVMGGASSTKEANLLQELPEIVIGTPGKILDHINNTKELICENIEFLVLDEADRLLDMGFIKEINEIIEKLPSTRQTILASATMNDSVKGLSKLALKSAVKIGKSGVPDTLDQKIVRIKDEMNREAVVLYLLNQETPKDVIVFVKTKKECHRLHLILQVLGKKSGELHGNLTQLQRLSAVNDFQNGDIDILITTDLAARGLDLPVKAVINMNIPREIQRLLHRIGRTARAGMSGISISLCTPNERSQLRKAVKQSIPSIKLNQELLEKAHDEISKANSEAKQMLHEEEMKKIELKRENEVKKEKKGKKPIKFKESSNEVAQADEQSELANKIKRHKLMASLKKRISDENKS